MSVCLDFLLESPLAPAEVVSRCAEILGVVPNREHDIASQDKVSEEWHFQYENFPFTLRIAQAGVAVETTMDWHFLWEPRTRSKYLKFARIFKNALEAQRIFLAPDIFLIVPNYIMSENSETMSLESALNTHYGPSLSLEQTVLNELENRGTETEAYFELS